MKIPILRGQGVALRLLDQEDAAAVLSWFNDPEVLRTLRQYRPFGLGGEERFFSQITESPTDLVLGITPATATQDVVVGVCGLHRIDLQARHAELGLAVARAHWRKGYGSEATRLLTRYAFECLNLNRVYLEVRADHVAAQRIYERAGFQREGLLRQHIYREGRYWDAVVMGLLRGSAG
jgi:RimJ/RimL family protein N-acetyltransferase